MSDREVNEREESRLEVICQCSRPEADKPLDVTIILDEPESESRSEIKIVVDHEHMTEEGMRTGALDEAEALGIKRENIPYQKE